MDNYGSISDLWVISSEDISSLDWNETNQNYDITLKSGKSFTQVSFIYESGYFGEKTIQDPNGPAWQTQISCIIAKHDKTYENTWKNLRHVRLAVLTLDNNDNYRISGDSRSGFFVQESAHTGEKFENRNQVVLMFEDTLPQPSYFVSSPL